MSAKDLIDRQHDMIRRRDLAGLPDLYEPTAVYAMPGFSVKPIELPALVGAYLAAFPDLRNEVGAWFESGDTVVLEQIVTGTHQGPLLTPFGPLPPTGKPIRQEAVEVVKVRNGKIVSWRTYVDQLPTMLDLGVVIPALRAG